VAQFPCLPLWTDAWVADTRHLRGPIGRQKRGAYMDLLVEMWRTPGCKVPNDNGWLQDHLGADKDELREIIRPVVEEFCTIEGNWIVQRRLQKEFLRVHQQSERLSSLRKRRKNNHKAINT
jgi:uncharacterized protein YdaU (DUF1376 family)